MIELSIINPTPKINPDKEIILMDNPKPNIIRMLIISDIGILMAMIKDDLMSFEKRNIINIARTLPINKLSLRLSIDIFSMEVWS